MMKRQYRERVPFELFNNDGHYLGRPASFDDRIIQRRLRLTRSINGFIGNKLTLLDIGCGNGASLFGLANEMKYCRGIDITNEHLSIFEKFKNNNNIENCDYQILDIESETPDNQFDRIISFEVIEHLKDENKGVYNYYRSLKKGGIIAISVPNKWWIFETHGAKLPWIPWNRVPFFSWIPRRIHERYSNVRIYTKRRIIRLLEENGFEVLSINYIMAPLDVLPEGKLKKFAIKNFFNKDTTSIPFKSTSIFVSARK